MSALDEVINNTLPAVGEMSELEGAKLGRTAPTPSRTPVIDALLAIPLPSREPAGIPALVAQFKEVDVPHANPPEAAKVLETQTAPEVAGELEPLTDEQTAAIAKADELAEFNEARVARGEKPLKRMPPEKKTRRTAPVVQVELDAAREEIDALKASQIGDAMDAPGLREELDAALAEIERLKSPGIQKQLAALRVETATAMTEQLKERDSQIAALRANKARIAETVLEGCRREDLALEEVKRLNKRITALEAETSPESSTPIEILARECEARGWKVNLSR